jgi:hypothetical protein
MHGGSGHLGGGVVAVVAAAAWLPDGEALTRVRSRGTSKRLSDVPNEAATNTLSRYHSSVPTDKSEVPQITLSVVQTARSSAEWLRYAAGGLIAGGSAVAIAMLLGVSNIQKPSYVTLALTYAVLLLASEWFSWRMMLPDNPMKTTKSLGLASTVIPGLLTIWIVIRLATAETGNNLFPVKSYTSEWWQTVGITLGCIILGSIKHKRADRHVETLKSLEKTLGEIERDQSKVAESQTGDNQQLPSSGSVISKLTNLGRGGSY